MLDKSLIQMILLAAVLATNLYIVKLLSKGSKFDFSSPLPTKPKPPPVTAAPPAPKVVPPATPAPIKKIENKKEEIVEEKK